MRTCVASKFRELEDKITARYLAAQFRFSIQTAFDGSFDAGPDLYEGGGYFSLKDRVLKRTTPVTAQIKGRRVDGLSTQRERATASHPEAFIRTRIGALHALP